jgi:hypothetical protein
MKRVEACSHNIVQIGLSSDSSDSYRGGAWFESLLDTYCTDSVSS